MSPASGSGRGGVGSPACGLGVGDRVRANLETQSRVEVGHRHRPGADVRSHHRPRLECTRADLAELLRIVRQSVGHDVGGAIDLRAFDVVGVRVRCARLLAGSKRCRGRPPSRRQAPDPPNGIAGSHQQAADVGEPCLRVLPPSRCNVAICSEFGGGPIDVDVDHRAGCWVDVNGDLHFCGKVGARSVVRGGTRSPRACLRSGGGGVAIDGDRRCGPARSVG